MAPGLDDRQRPPDRPSLPRSRTRRRRSPHEAARPLRGRRARLRSPPIDTSARRDPVHGGQRGKHGPDAVLAGHSVDAGAGDHARKIVHGDIFRRMNISLSRPRRDRAPDGRTHRRRRVFRSPSGIARVERADDSRGKRARGRPPRRPTPRAAPTSSSPAFRLAATSSRSSMGPTACSPAWNGEHARRLHVRRSRDLADDSRGARRARRRLPRRAGQRRRDGRREGHAHRHGRWRRGGARARAPVLETFAQKIVHCGDVGAGDAVKAVNQALLAIHIWPPPKARALVKQGVEPEVALDVINASSGRSNSR